MKKFLLLITTFLLVACSSKPEEKQTVNKTCSISDIQNMNIEFKLEANSEDNLISNLGINIDMNLSDFGLSSDFDLLNDQKKDQIVASIFSQLGFNGTNHEGLSFDYQVDGDRFKLNLELDIDKCSDDLLNTLGFNEENLKYNETIELFTTSGYTCN